MSRLCCSITQDGQKKGASEADSTSCLFLFTPAHQRWYQVWQPSPSQKITSCPATSIVASKIISWQVGQVCSSFPQLSSIANGGSRAVLLVLHLRTSSWTVRACRGFPLVDLTSKGTGACAVAAAGVRCDTEDWGCSAEMEASRGVRA